MTHPPQDERESLESAIAAARRDLVAAEDENRRLHAELSLVERSVGLRVLVKARQRAGEIGIRIRHPLWSAGTVARRLGTVGPVAAGRRAATHLVRRAHPFRLLAPVRSWTDRGTAAEAVRWVGPIAIRHARREALFCHPNSGIEYRLSAMPGSAFVTEVALSPFVWRERPSAVEFTVEIRSLAGDWTRSTQLIVDVTRRVTDRRWHKLRIEIPPEVDRYGADIAVTLSTTVPSGASTDGAWALFAEPRLERRRPASEVKRSVAAFVSRVRHAGLRSALRVAHDASAGEDKERYAKWCSTTTPTQPDLEQMVHEAEALPFQPRIDVVTPVYNTDPKWLRACIESVRAQIYPHWHLCLADDASSSPATLAVLREYEADPRISIVYLEKNSHISAASNAALKHARGEYVALLDHDDELTPDALFHVARFLNRVPDADLIYSDEDKLDLTGSRCDPYFKPDWSPDHFLTCMYTCHLMVVRRTLLEEIGGFRRGYEGAQDYDLVLRLMERNHNIHHIPRILYHWRKLPESTATAGLAKPWAMDAGRLALEDYIKRNGLAAEVLPGPAPGVFRIKREIRGTPLISIIIPTAGRLRREGSREFDLLAACVRSIRQLTSWPHYELIVVAEPAGLQQETVAALHGCRHTVVTDAAAPFNFSRKINLGAAQATGEHLVLLNDDVEVTDPEWLSSMLEQSQDPGVGAVGAKLLYPDGRLQHIGMVLGVGGIAAHAFHQHPGASPGYASSALSIRNYSAVTAACLMTRREVFEEVGRFDESLPVDFNDIDFCLRVRKAGLRVVFTPYAQLFHHESASVGSREKRPEDVELMRQRWGAWIEDDPYYNPNLTREGADYRLREPSDGKW
jgi:GT2 family glycosyltransferase